MARGILALDDLLVDVLEFWYYEHAGCCAMICATP